MSKFTKIKLHFRENKKVYITGGVCLVIGALAATKVIQINYKSPGATNILVEAPKRNMHPGYLVQDNETGMTQPSLRAMAKATGVDRNKIKDNDRFEILGEAVA